jgi:broad specificity phosphatase PhoE
MSQTLEALECTHCHARMSEHRGSGGRVRYFNCGGCHRWFSTSYAEVLRADAKFVARPAEEKKDESFDEVKSRLEQWLSALDQQDPYRILGVTRADSAEDIKRRYRTLALERHPDLGGSVEQMSTLNAAYERLARHHRPAQSRPARLPRHGHGARVGVGTRTAG